MKIWIEECGRLGDDKNVLSTYINFEPENPSENALLEIWNSADAAITANIIPSDGKVFIAVDADFSKLTKTDKKGGLNV